MAYMRSTGQEAGKINVHKTKRSITERGRKKMRKRMKERQRRTRRSGTRTAIRPKEISGLIQEKEGHSIHLKETQPETEFLVVVVVWL